MGKMEVLARLFTYSLSSSAFPIGVFCCLAVIHCSTLPPRPASILDWPGGEATRC